MVAPCIKKYVGLTLAAVLISVTSHLKNVTPFIEIFAAPSTSLSYNKNWQPLLLQVLQSRQVYLVRS